MADARSRTFPAATGLLIAVLAAGASAAAPAPDTVTVAGGAAAIRRLLGIDPARGDATLFADANSALLFETGDRASWKDVGSRRKVVRHLEEVGEWHAQFGPEAVFPAAGTKDAIARTRRALSWLGFQVKGDRAPFTVEARVDAEAVRRQGFLDLFGISTSSVVRHLASGKPVTIATPDSSIPLPFGLAAWRETLDRDDLSAANAFDTFVRNVGASRMLLALSSMDPDTRETLRTLVADGRGRNLGWRLLFTESLGEFARYPEALTMRDGAFVLPGGPAAEEVWTDVFKVSPRDRVEFLRALYQADGGKAAYVVDALQQLPEAAAKAIVLGRTAGGRPAVERFRRLYDAIESAGGNFDRTLRDPFDFAHLAPFLPVSGDGVVDLPAGADVWWAALSDSRFPEGEDELGALLADAKKRPPTPEDFLGELFGRYAGVKVESSPQRRFLVVSSLLARRPALREPGLIVLLFRGVERLASSYAALEDLPIDAAAARRYLFCLDRLDRRSRSRRAEVTIGLFQGSVEILGAIARAEALDTATLQHLFGSLLDLPPLEQDDAAAARPFAGWLGELVGALRRTGEPNASADELLLRALVGTARPVGFGWRGGRYRFDPAADEIGRRRQFIARQRLASVDAVEAMRAARDDISRNVRAGDVGKVRSVLLEYVDLLGVRAAERVPARDGRVASEMAAARDSVAWFGALDVKRLKKVEDRLEALDTVLGERALEAVLAHVYAISAGDPDDLFYLDPELVSRHAFRPTTEVAAVEGFHAFAATRMERTADGKGSVISGALAGLPDVLGLLHAEQLTYGAQSAIPNEHVRAALLGSVRRMSVARLDDDALAFVAACGRVAGELAAALAGRPGSERARPWMELARGIAPRARVALLAGIDDASRAEAAVSAVLTPSDLYHVGRRAALERAAGLPALPAAAEAREAHARLVARLGAEGARDRLAELGPRPVAYAGDFRLADIVMPSYERLSAYRYPQLFCDRLFDIKVAAARRVHEAGLPAAVLPLVVGPAADEVLVNLRMAYTYDWLATVRPARELSRADVDRLLVEALEAGRLVREDETEEETR